MEEEEQSIEEEILMLQSMFEASSMMFSPYPTTPTRMGDQRVKTALLPDGSVEISVELLPRDCEAADIFVQGTLKMIPPPLYPKEPCIVHAEEVQGLPKENVALLEEKLKTVSNEMAERGEMGLVMIASAMQDYVTEENYPHGRCMICLDEFKATCDCRAVQGPCAHAFHGDCLMHWYQAEQQQRREQEQARLQEDPHGHRILKTQPIEQGTARCPVCKGVLPAFLMDIAASRCRTTKETDMDVSGVLKSEWVISGRKEREVLYERQLKAGGVILPAENEEHMDGLIVIRPVYADPKEEAEEEEEKKVEVQGKEVEAEEEKKVEVEPKEETTPNDLWKRRGLDSKPKISTDPKALKKKHRRRRRKKPKQP